MKHYMYKINSVELKQSIIFFTKTNPNHSLVWFQCEDFFFFFFQFQSVGWTNQTK